MKNTKITTLFICAAFFAGCETAPTTRNATTNSNLTATNAVIVNANNQQSSAQALIEVPRPEKISDQMLARGEQDAASPTVKVLEPKNGANLANSIIKIKLELGGDLKGYKPMKDMTTGMGNHIHVILDNQPYEAYYNLEQEFELRNVADGEHTLRVFPSRPWHESYKSTAAFQMVKFTVKNGGAQAAKPTVTNSGQTMANANSNLAAAAPPEGKEMANSTAGAVDASKPLLTYSRPKGEYKNADAENIMVDFWLTNAKLVGDGGEYRVKYSVDGGADKFIEKWQPIWIAGWSAGAHRVKLELVDKSGNLVDNGSYNSTVREITVVK